MQSMNQPGDTRFFPLGNRQFLRTPRLCAGAAILTIASTVSVATASTADAGADDSMIQEIIVTAQKVAEDVQKVPISMTVISGDTLVQEGVHDFNGVLAEIPNLSFQYGTAGDEGMGLSSSRGISIRGISGTNTTSVYIDDTPVPVSIEPYLLDIDHIEVLKGPQGTLYGQASMGGTVRMVTVSPSTDAVAGTVDVDAHNLQGGGLGTFDSFKVNVPLSNDLAMRVGMFYNYDPGFLSRTYNDPTAIDGQFATGPAITVNHVGTVDAYGGSVSLRFSPQDSGLVISPMLIAQTTHSNGFLATDNTTDDYVQRRVLNVPEGWTDTFYLAGLNVSAESAIGNFVSSTSYFYRDSFDQEDGSDVTLQLFDFNKLLPVFSLSNLYNEQFTQEFRLVSQVTSRFQTTAGLYFNDALGIYDQSVQSPGASPGLIPGAIAASGGTLNTDTGYLSHQPTRSTEKSAYLSGTYSLTNQLKLTAGLRESYLHSEALNTTTGFYNGGSSAFDLPYSAHAVTPRFSAQYQFTDDHMVYASAAKGFRPGGTQSLPGICAANLAAIGRVPGPNTYDSDSLWNYEVGAKTKWFDDRLMVNIAVYDMQWNRIQQLVELTSCGFDIDINGAAARSRGSELEIAIAPVTGLTISVSGGYADARITGVLPNSASLYVGQRLNGVPEVTAAAFAEYKWPTTYLGRAFFRVDDNYVGNSLSLNNSTIIGLSRPAYDLLDLRLGTEMKSNLVVSFYAKNVLDSHPNLGDEIAEVVETAGRPRYIVGDPTSFGVEVRKKF
jgi:iron complex outermembrane recepter protein